jgi:phytoene/squalene synthetase
MDSLANDMGLFLQKTNIIRDYLEDIMEEPAPRMFWPKEIWGEYAQTLDEFKDPQNRYRQLPQPVCGWRRVQSCCMAVETSSV